MRKGIPEVMMRTVMSLYEGAKTRARVGLDLELSEEFEVKVGVHQGCCIVAICFCDRGRCGYGECEKWFDE